jgi:hypothetical protein
LDSNDLEQTVPIDAPIPGTYPTGQPSLGLRPYGDSANNQRIEFQTRFSFRSVEQLPDLPSLFAPFLNMSYNL